MTDVWRGHGMELHCADWQMVERAGPIDAIITDPPYGERTHRGHDSGGPQIASVTGQSIRRGIEYSCWPTGLFEESVEAWSRMCRGWVAVMTSHDLIPAFEAATERAGRYSFAPIPVIQKRPRLFGDGPANWCVYLMVSRPKTREAMRWRCLPGMYESWCEKDSSIVGAKPLELMRQIVRDYSNPGDLVCDPCAGGGTTLLAAAMEGRRAVGAEIDPDTFAAACRRLQAGYTIPMALEET